MLRQVVAPHEAFLTLAALKAFVSCVRPGVSLQLVAACETFPTENPVADEGPFASVQPDVSSEQRRFPERLLTAGDVADVLPFTHLPRPLVCVFTVGAGAGHSSLLFSWLAGQLQGEGLVYLDGRLARCCCQLEPSALHRLDREVLLAPCVGDGDRNSLNLDPVDADGLHGLSC